MLTDSEEGGLVLKDTDNVSSMLRNTEEGWSNGKGY